MKMWQIWAKTFGNTGGCTHYHCDGGAAAALPSQSPDRDRCHAEAPPGRRSVNKVSWFKAAKKTQTPPLVTEGGTLVSTKGAMKKIPVNVAEANSETQESEGIHTTSPPASIQVMVISFFTLGRRKINAG